MEKIKRLVNERFVEIAAHIVFDMPRSINQQPPLPEQEKRAHQADAQNPADVITDDRNLERTVRHAAFNIVNRLADEVWNIEPEQHPEKNKQDAGKDVPFVRRKITRKFSKFFHKTFKV